MILKEFRIIRGQLVCQTGLHIGAGKDTIEIGGVDAPIVKHPITQEPYIPGSSLKGRMRSLLEKKLNKFSGRDANKPCGCGRTDCIVCKLFGAHNAHENPSSQVAPTRVIVRDAYLTQKTREEFRKILAEKGKSYLEIKAENMVDRRTGVATNPPGLVRPFQSLA
ncbi:MAG: type III-A CRISPR-associated RAMP protein Csm3 [Bacillota bacterium]